jgi:hypothetical protein
MSAFCWLLCSDVDRCKASFVCQRYPSSYVYSQFRLHFPAVTAKLNTATGASFAYVGVKELGIDMLTRPSSGRIDVSVNSLIISDPDDYRSRDASIPPFLLGRPGRNAPCLRFSMDDFQDSADAATVAPLVVVGTRVDPPVPCFVKIVVQPVHIHHSQRVLAGLAEFASSDVVPDADLLHVEPPPVLPAEMHIAIVLSRVQYSVRHESEPRTATAMRSLPSPVVPSHPSAFTTPIKHHNLWGLSDDPTLRTCVLQDMCFFHAACGFIRRWLLVFRGMLSQRLSILSHRLLPRTRILLAACPRPI